MEEANAEYTILVSADHWGPQGKPDQDGAPETLYTRMELNNLVQEQVLAALKQFKTQLLMDKTNESSNQNKKKTNNDDESSNKPKQQIPKTSLEGITSNARNARNQTSG